MASRATAAVGNTRLRAEREKHEHTSKQNNGVDANEQRRNELVAAFVFCFVFYFFPVLPAGVSEGWSILGLIFSIFIIMDSCPLFVLGKD